MTFISESIIVVCKRSLCFSIQLLPLILCQSFENLSFILAEGIFTLVDSVDVL